MRQWGDFMETLSLIDPHGNFLKPHGSHWNPMELYETPLKLYKTTCHVINFISKMLLAAHRTNS